MKVKTSELTGAALDWAVAICSGTSVNLNLAPKPPVMHLRGFKASKGSRWIPSQKWSQGGPIIEREKLTLIWTPKSGFWSAYELQATTENYKDRKQNGDTPLIAAMRCYVASKLGNEIDIPEELK